MILCLLCACSNDEKPTESTVKDGNLSQKVEVALYAATDFSEQKALVLFSADDNLYNIGVLSTTGEIVKINEDEIKITITEEEKYKTIGNDWCNFDNGFAYVNYVDNISDPFVSYKRFLILNTKGDVETISPLDADYSILCGGDGIYFVKQETKGSLNEEKTINFGVVNSSGQWICSPASLDYYGASNIGTSINDLISFEYLGESIFSIFYDRSNMPIDAGMWLTLFNSATKTNAEFMGMKMLSLFQNGKALAYNVLSHSTYTQGTGTDLYIIDKDAFERKTVFDDISIGGSSGGNMTISSVPILSDELIFGIECYDREQPYHPYLGPEYKFYPMFFDLNGNTVIDLSQYNFFSTNNNDKNNGLFQFINGFCVLEIDGKDGTYVTTINKTGNNLYEPIKIKKVLNIDFDDNTIAVLLDRNIEGISVCSNAFINATSGEMELTEFELDGKWHSGFCRLDNYFIKTNGEQLITYTE